MTCEECDKIQNLAFDKNEPQTVPIAYVRIDIANVAIVGCKHHLGIVCDIIRKSVRKK